MIPEHVELRILRAIRSNSRFDSAVGPTRYILTSSNELGTKVIWMHTDFPVFYEAIQFVGRARQMTVSEITKRIEHRYRHSRPERLARIHAVLSRSEAA